jgi:hypothetical protein
MCNPKATQPNSKDISLTAKLHLMNLVKNEIGCFSKHIEDSLALEANKPDQHIKPIISEKRRDSYLTQHSKSTTASEEDFTIILHPTNAKADKLSTDYIIDNLNRGECLNNPKRLERIEKGYKYLRNLVHKLKLPSLNKASGYSFTDCNKLKCNKECDYYLSSSELDFNIEKYECLSVKTEPDEGSREGIIKDKFRINMLQCQWDSKSYYTNLTESEDYNSDCLSIVTDDEY